MHRISINSERMDLYEIAAAQKVMKQLREAIRLNDKDLIKKSYHEGEFVDWVEVPESMFIEWDKQQGIANDILFPE